MSVRLSSSGAGRLSRASSVPDYNSGPYWFRALIYPVRVSGTQMNVLSVFQGLGAFDLLYISTGAGGRLAFNTAGGSATVDLLGSVLNPNTWYYVSVERASATDVDVYLGEAPDVIALDMDGTGNTSGRAAATTVGIGFVGSGFSTFDGRVFAPRISAAVPANAAEREADAAAMFDALAGALADWPLAAHTDLTDRAGNGSLTSAGTISTEADPPVDPWGGAATNDRHGIITWEELQVPDLTEPPPPVAAFSSVQSSPKVVDFTDESTADGSLVTWSWDFGDGSALGTTQHPQHTYAQAGTYQVTLTVTDDENLSDDITHPVTVNNPPVAQSARRRAAALLAAGAVPTQ